jgi:hypothetical protein
MGWIDRAGHPGDKVSHPKFRGDQGKPRFGV